ncbi:hypothetical protein AHF37_05875 [Paragonimus kellicotti]|nr:hypothetical protein AHF37_05875 [Paragonimus kellicotti]
MPFPQFLTSVASAHDLLSPSISPCSVIPLSLPRQICQQLLGDSRKNLNFCYPPVKSRRKSEEVFTYCLIITYRKPIQLSRFYRLGHHAACEEGVRN